MDHVIYVTGVLHTITHRSTRIVRVGQEGMHGSVPNLVHMETLWASTLLCRNKMWKKLTSWVQENKVQWDRIYQDYRPQFHSSPPRQRQPKEDSKKEGKENRGDGSHPSQHWYYPNLNYSHGHPKNPKPHDGKETKAADLSAENPSALEAKQGRAE